MSFIRKIKKKSGTYLAEVESYRDGPRVRQRLIRYLGKEGSLQAEAIVNKDRVITEKRPAVVNKEAIKTVSDTKTMGKVESKAVTTTVTPLDFQIVLQRRAADNHMSAEDYIRKLLTIPIKEGDNTITLPDDLMAQIPKFREVKSGKKTVAEWAISKIRFHAFGPH